MLLPLSIRRLVHSLCEVGYLYRRFSQSITRSERDASAGQVMESFIAAMRAECTEYFKLIAALESQINGVSVLYVYLCALSVSLCSMCVSVLHVCLCAVCVPVCLLCVLAENCV